MSTADAPREAPTGEAVADLEELVARFEDAWQAGERPALEDYLPAGGAGRRAALVELIHTDLEYRLLAGEPARVEEYLRRHPELADDRAVVLLLIVAEWNLRQQLPRPTPDEYLRRFPHYSGELSGLLPTPHPSPPGPPSPGGGGEPPRRSAPTEGIGRLGKFVLLEKLGAGACGTVYRAWDGALRRTVALKVLRAGEQGGPPELDRFLREAHSAADLHHPGIAALYEAGQVEGVPYLASEYVPGQTLAARLRAGPVPCREAAAWLVRAAEALHHAHEHGVIHRDIKSSNIQIDPEGNPHLLDFGLARWEGADSTLTQEGEPLGTPAYMSPEQARGEAHSVDRRSDVYGLGVVLYEALTGQLPFRGSSRMVLAQVLAGEPPAPRRLNDSIPRDLETVCLKAMAREPSRRYPTGLALAEDLRRFLAGRPVLARPVGAAGRLWRWARRNPAPAGLVAALVLVAALGFAGVTWQWRRAARHLAESERQRLRAEQGFDRARRSWHNLTALFRDSLTDEVPGPVREELKAKALEECRAFVEQCGDDPALRPDVARAYRLIGSLHYDQGGSGSLEKALEAYQKSLSLWEQLAGEQPAVFEFRRERASALFTLSVVRLHSDPSAVAVPRLRQARELLAELVREDSADLDLHVMLAGCELELGGWLYQTHQLAEARSFAEQAGARLDRLAREKTWRAHVAEPLAGRLNSLAALQQQVGQLGQALGSQQKAIDLLEGLLPQKPASVKLRKRLAGGYFNLGWMQQDSGRPAEALRSHQRGYALMEKLARENPSSQLVRGALAQQSYGLARAQTAAGQPGEALRLYRQAAAIWEQLVVGQPLQGYRRDLAASYHNLGNLHADRGEVDRARHYYEKALPIREKLCRASPENLIYRSDLAGEQHKLGEALEGLGRRREALAAYRAAVEQQRAVVRKVPGSPTHRRRLAQWYLSLARVQRELGHPRDAVAALLKVLKCGGEDPGGLYAVAREFARCLLDAMEGKAVVRP